MVSESVHGDSSSCVCTTLLTKQHVIADVAGGVILAELCFCIGRKTELYRIYEKFGSRIEQKILEFTEG